MYNFEVTDWHTYFVGERETFVHNLCVTSRIVKEKVNNSGGRYEVLVAFLGHRGQLLAYDGAGAYEVVFDKRTGLFGWQAYSPAVEGFGDSGASVDGDGGGIGYQPPF